MVRRTWQGQGAARPRRVRQLGQWLEPSGKWLASSSRSRVVAPRSSAASSRSANPSSLTSSSRSRRRTSRCKQAGCTQGYLSDVERGNTKIAPEKLEALLAAYEFNKYEADELRELRETGQPARLVAGVPGHLRPGHIAPVRSGTRCGVGTHL